VWERTAVSVDLAQGEDLGVAWYRGQGFQASEAGIATTTGPLLTNVTLAVRGRDLVLESAPEHRALEQFDDVVSTAPPGWLAAVRVGGRCLLVVGETLGLERASVARIDALLAGGRAVAAVVGVEWREAESR